MRRTQPPSSNIVLTTPCRDRSYGEFKQALAEMGYSVQTARDVDRLARSAANEVLICFFKTAPSSREQHQKFLRLTKREAVLAVVAEDVDRDCRPLVDNCTDFCNWPCQVSELEIRIDRALRKTRSSGARSKAESPPANPLNRLVGEAPNFVNSIKQIHRIAPYDAPVLLTGETGTGKEIVARAIHYQSSRRDGPFIPVNCGAIPESLIENELFGHRRGAYTDANKDQQGLLEQAHSGTLFLDEVDALPLKKGQTALLRVLEDLEYRPLGSESTVSIDVRLITATNRRLTDLVELGEFRSDLFYRLNILRIKLPPLRERGRDIKLLSEHFLKVYSAQYGLEKKISPGGLSSLLNHSWPGNVRELQNFLHREFLQQEEDVLRCRSLINRSLAITSSLSEHEPDAGLSSFQDAKSQAISQFERSYLVDVLSRSSGNISQAARLAGKERRALGRLLQKHNIDAANFRDG